MGLLYDDQNDHDYAEHATLTAAAELRTCRLF
jgi:hypothetical protein